MQNIGGLIETFKMMYIMNVKDSGFYENFGMLIFITFLTFIMNNDNCYEKFEKNIGYILDNLTYFFPKKNVIVLEGKRCMKVTSYITKTDNLFSNRFNAFWYYISKNNLQNPTIYSLKEYANSSNIYDDYGEPKNIKKRFNRNYNDEINNIDSDNEEEDFSNKDIFIVDQPRHFKINDNIFCTVMTSTDRSDEKKQYEMENIKIEVYSYNLSLKNISNFLDNLEYDYRKSLERSRKNKKFIYTLIGSNNKDSNYDREIKNVWEECEFNSTRNFSNLFFDNKKHLINKLNFFINNKNYYEYEGHPYTFGIGLHGPPGTGKTSVIKCIANKLNRHIIVIPLNKIKTQREFSEYFFEQYYSRNNNQKIGFEDKIIVFEDIDCMSDIVKKRDLSKKTEKFKENKNTSYNNNDNNPDNEDNNNNNNNNKESIELLSAQNKLLNKIAKKVDDEHTENVLVDFSKNEDDKITLSFILNIIDGLRETPGRILIITSNDYDSLDPALIRPGRIDMTLEMKNASIDTIKEMYNHFYKDILPDEIETQLEDHIISPAKLVNMRLEYENKKDFIEALIKEFS